MVMVFACYGIMKWYLLIPLFGFISEFVVGGDGQVGDVGASIVLSSLSFPLRTPTRTVSRVIPSGLDPPFSGA